MSFNVPLNTLYIIHRWEWGKKSFHHLSLSLAVRSHFPLSERGLYPRTAKHFHNSPVLPLRLAKVDDYYRIQTLIYNCTLDFSHCYRLLYSHQKCDTRKYCCLQTRGCIHINVCCVNTGKLCWFGYMYMCWWWWYGCLVGFIPFYYCIWIIYLILV